MKPTAFPKTLLKVAIAVTVVLSLSLNQVAICKFSFFFPLYIPENLEGLAITRGPTAALRICPEHLAPFFLNTKTNQ